MKLFWSRARRQLGNALTFAIAFLHGRLQLGQENQCNESKASPMKTLQYFILAMVVLPLVALGQNPIDGGAKVPPVSPIDSIQLEYPAGSVQYPSPAAFSLSQTTAISQAKLMKERESQSQYFEEWPAPSYNEARQLLNDRRLHNRFQINDKQLCRGHKSCFYVPLCVGQAFRPGFL